MRKVNTTLSSPFHSQVHQSVIQDVFIFPCICTVLVQNLKEFLRHVILFLHGDWYRDNGIPVCFSADREQGDGC